MKKIVFLIALVITSNAYAQDELEKFYAQNEFEKSLEKMTQTLELQMKKVEACQQKINKQKLASLEERTRIHDAKIEELCSVNREKAGALDQSFMEKELQDPEIMAMFKCIQMEPEEDASGDEDDFSHVCD